MAEASFFRVSLRFMQYDRKWWEVYGNSKSTIAQVVETLPAVRDAALTFRHPSCYISHARISNPFAPRQAQIAHLRNPDRTIGTAVPEVSSTAAIYEFAGADAGVKRHLWVRGLRRTDVGRRPGTGEDTPQGELDAGVRAYFEVLRNNAYGIPNLFPVDGTANARHPIPSITVLPLGKVKIIADEAFVFGDRKRMMLYKIDQKLFPGLKGSFKTSGDATGFVALGYRSHLAEGSYPQFDAAFRVEAYRFTAFIAGGATFLAFDRRDTKGGPLDTRGRQRAVSLRSR